MRVVLTGVKRVQRALSHPTGPMRKALDESATVYAAAMAKRFDRYSRGSGDWPDIKPETKRRKRSSRILVDKRYMRLGLQQAIVLASYSPRVAMRFTFNRRGRRHPEARMSIGDLLTIHHLGLGNNLAARRILDAPDQPTRARITGKINRAMSLVHRGKA